MLLEQPEAVGVNRADKEAVEPIECLAPQPRHDSCLYSVLQFRRRALGEREGDNGIRPNALGQEIRDPLRDDLGLARPSRRNDLHVGTTVLNCSESIAFKSGRVAQVVKILRRTCRRFGKLAHRISAYQRHPRPNELSDPSPGALLEQMVATPGAWRTLLWTPNAQAEPSARVSAKRWVQAIEPRCQRSSRRLRLPKGCGQLSGLAGLRPRRLTGLQRMATHTDPFSTQPGTRQASV